MKRSSLSGRNSIFHCKGIKSSLILSYKKDCLPGEGKKIKIKKVHGINVSVDLIFMRKGFHPLPCSLAVPKIHNGLERL